MHICLNMLESWTGGSIYIQNLVHAITTLPVEERSQLKLSIAVRASNLDLVSPVRPYIDNVYVIHLWDRVYLKIFNVLAELVSFIPLQALNPQKVDFVYPDLSGKRFPCQWGAWIPDFQHYHLANLFSPKEIASRNRAAQKIASAAPVIILSSKMAQEDFNRLYPEASSRSTVMNFFSHLDPEWLQLDPQLTQEKYGLPDNFFLISNQFWKHKDHAVVIESLAVLKRQGIKPTVVCTGKTSDPRHPEYYNELQARIEKFGIADQVRILGLIPRIDQIQLMRRCLAIIQPSLFEGWSTVVEDGRALGKLMLLSDFPVHIEQNPPYSYFFERSNSEQLASLISTVFSTLKPGPDLEKESLAKQENRDRVADYGRRFIGIVRSVL